MTRTRRVKQSGQWKRQQNHLKYQQAAEEWFMKWEEEQCKRESEMKER